MSELSTLRAARAPALTGTPSQTTPYHTAPDPQSCQESHIFDGWHIVILVLVIVIVFGWKRLPDAARSLGRSARILKSEADDFKAENQARSEASGHTVPGQTAAPQQSPQHPPADQSARQQADPWTHTDGTGPGA